MEKATADRIQRFGLPAMIGFAVLVDLVAFFWRNDFTDGAAIGVAMMWPIWLWMVPKGRPLLPRLALAASVWLLGLAFLIVLHHGR